MALPMLRAASAEHGPVALVHFDAHLDTWDTYMSAPYTHGTPFRRAAEESLFLQGHSMHVGIRRPLYSQYDLIDDAALGFSVVGTWETDDIGAKGIVERIRERVDGICVDRHRRPRPCIRSWDGYSGDWWILNARTGDHPARADRIESRGCRCCRGCSCVRSCRGDVDRRRQCGL